MFSVSPSSITPTDGKISDTEVTVTYTPTDAGSHEATLTVSSTGATAQTIALSGTAIAPLPHYTVNWMVNGNPYSEGTPSTDVEEGDKVSILPTTPATIGGKVFMGWTNATIEGTQDDAPAVLFTTAADAPAVTTNTTYYAVYAQPNAVIGEINSKYDFTELGDPLWNVDEAIVRTANQGTGGTGDYAGKINTNNTYITFSEKVKVKEFGFAFKRTSTNKNYYVYIETSTDNTTWTPRQSYTMDSFNNGSYTTVTDNTFDGETEIYVRFHCYNTTAVRYVDDVIIKYVGETYTYSAYATSVEGSMLSNRNLAFSESAVDFFDGIFATPTLSGHTDGVKYASSDTEVATVNETTGEITIGTKFGTTTITASADEDANYYADETSYTISVWPTSISGLKTLITSTSEIDFKVKLNNAIITYADANNAYLQDADAAILIYIKEGHTMTAGQSYTGVASGKATLYKGLREITSINWGTITPEAASIPAAETVTLAELNADYDKYESMYVYVQNAIVSSALTSRNATISQGSEEYNVYDKNNGLEGTALSTTNAIANLFGFPGVYNTTYQLNVFNDIDVEEIGYNLAVSAAGYATYFNSAKAYTMPAGATGHVWNEGNIEAAYEPADVVPANEPLVIEAAASNYPLLFTTSTEETWKSIGMNALEGTDAETDLTADDNYYFYGLSLNKSSEAGSVGFYWMNATGAAFTNGAHKAYLKLAKSVFGGSQAVNGFPFNGSTTGIEQIEAGADAKNVIYDLSGRRVNKAAKGIYIVNGKKVLVK
ncbi:MAG: hypothetical protein ACI3YC_01000 [Alloprevotella sp.]